MRESIRYAGSLFTCLENALEEGRLSEDSIELFLSLFLQEVPNLALAQVAANLSPKAYATHFSVPPL